jgi:hypothetical protein
MKTNWKFGICALALGGALVIAVPANAQDHHSDGSARGDWHGGGWHGNGGWHGGPRGRFMPARRFVGHDFAHFSVSDRAAWRGGHWWHGPYNGRNGWWWFAGGGWYFYDTPIYPYPGYVSDYYVDDGDYADAPGDNAYSWYYCQNPPGYYPYIQSCNGQWQQVPAGAPPGYSQNGPMNGPANQGPAPAYNDGPNNQYGPPPGYNQNGPPPGYDNGPGPNDQQGPPPNGH